MDEKIKTWTLRFPAKENPNMEKALFDWPIVLQYDVKAKYRLISRKFFGHEVFSAECSLNQPKATRVCVRSINQSNRSISVCLFFLFCSRVFISRLYKNRSKTNLIPATCYLPIIHLSLYLHLSPSQHQADITQPETKLLVSQYACATLKKMSEINKGTEGRQWTAVKKRKKTRFNCSCNSAVGLSRLCS